MRQYGRSSPCLVAEKIEDTVDGNQPASCTLFYPIDITPNFMWNVIQRSYGSAVSFWPTFEECFASTLIWRYHVSLEAPSIIVTSLIDAVIS
jgi:hypothetical protein